MSETVDGDAHGEVQIALAGRRKQVAAFAMVELEFGVAIIAHQCRSHRVILGLWSWAARIARRSRSGFVIHACRAMQNGAKFCACRGLDQGAIMPYRRGSFKPPGLLP